jgi:hypothetical protein
VQSFFRIDNFIRYHGVYLPYAGCVALKASMAAASWRGMVGIYRLDPLPVLDDRERPALRPLVPTNRATIRQHPPV